MVIWGIDCSNICAHISTRGIFLSLWFGINHININVLFVEVSGLVLVDSMDRHVLDEFLQFEDEVNFGRDMFSLSKVRYIEYRCVNNILS